MEKLGKQIVEVIFVADDLTKEQRHKNMKKGFMEQRVSVSQEL